MIAALREVKAVDDVIDLSDWLDDMVRDMSPVVQIYATEGIQQAAARIGLVPDALSVVQPKIREAVQRQVMEFCADTLASTERAVTEAYDQLKQEMAAGLVEGNTRPELARRVQTVFEDLGSVQAHLIAVTEASRAQHFAQIETAKDSGLVEGMQFLLSTNACPKCQAVNDVWGGKVVPFGVNISGNPYTADTMGVPVHPSCFCTWTEVLKEN